MKPQQGTRGERSTRRGNTGGIVAGGILLVIVAIALFAPAISPHDPLQLNIADRLHPPAWSPGGTAGHLLGTDELGRDIISRIVYGARTTLTVTGLAVTLGALLGSGLGLLSGYRRGAVDIVLGRVADVQQALPFIVVVLALAAVTGPSFVNVVLVLGVSSWVVHYRIVRGATMAIREESYIEAARAVGLSDAAILWRHVLPNVLPVIIVNVATFVPQLMLFEAALSFLGLGVPPPTPTWGGMIAAGRGYVEVAWWMSVFPGLALMTTVVAVHGIGEWLTGRFDPRQDRSR